MNVFILVFVGMLLCVAAMAVGVMMGRKPIQGSCGGLGALGVKQGCEICGGDANKCESTNVQRKSVASGAPGYDAMQGNRGRSGS